MEEIYDFGIILQKLRKKRGMTQEQLAHLIHKESSIISRYESGLQNPTFETVKEFAAIFNVSMDYLAGIKHNGTVSTHGLTVAQHDSVQALIDAYRVKNSQTLKQISQEQFAVLGKITAELTK